MIILSGGTSKGAGDLSYRVVSRLGNPGIVAHGVALKPGKPICLAVTAGKPVVVLPGFPTSAIFTFHEFVAPVLRAFAGLPPGERRSVEATLPLRVNSERGRTEYLLVSLIEADHGLAAYPMGKGSGSVTAFSYADGFVTIDQHEEIVEAGSRVDVQLLGEGVQPAALVAIGSHCVGLDYLLGELQERGITVKALHVGSMGGLAAARAAECDIAGIHLMDPRTGEYNRPLLDDEPRARSRAIGACRASSSQGRSALRRRRRRGRVARRARRPVCTMVNRNAGSGTRILIDRLLDGRQPPGYGVQAKSHNAVAAAVVQGRADWGMAIDTVAKQYGLGFIPVQEEHYDFAVPKARSARPAVQPSSRCCRIPGSALICSSWVFVSTDGDTIRLENRSAGGYHRCLWRENARTNSNGRPVMLRLAILMVWGLLPALAQAQATFDKIKTRGHFVVGYREDAPPFSYQDEKKQPLGYSLEFCEAIVGKVRAQPGMGKLKVVHTPVPVDRILTYVSEGTVDLLCSSTSDTAERRTQVAFSQPIYFDSVGVMVRKKDNVSRLEQLKGKKVVLIKATTAVSAINEYLTKSGGGWKLEEVLNGDAALSQLQLGWSAGYARDKVLLAVQRASSPAPDDYLILPDRLSSETIAIAYRKDDGAMKALVDGAIGEAIASGKAQEWHDKWFMKPIPLDKSRKPLGVPMSAELKAALTAKK